MKKIDYNFVKVAFTMLLLPMISYGNFDNHYRNNPSIEKTYQAFTENYVTEETVDELIQLQCRLKSEDFLYENKLELFNTQHSGASKGYVGRGKETDVIWFLKTGQAPYRQYFTAKLLELILGSNRIPVAKLIKDKPDWVASRLLRNFVTRGSATAKILAEVKPDPLINMCLAYLAVEDRNDGNIGYVFIDEKWVETAIDFDYSLKFNSGNSNILLNILVPLLEGKLPSYQTLSQERVLQTLEAFLAVPEEQIQAAIVQLIQDIEIISNQSVKKKSVKEILENSPLIIYFKLITSRIKLRQLKNLVEGLKTTPDLTDDQKDSFIRSFLEATSSSQEINHLPASTNNNQIAEYIHNLYDNDQQNQDFLNNTNKFRIESGIIANANDLFQAVRSDDKPFIEFLLEIGVDVNSRDSEGKSALIIAGQDYNLSLMQFLAKKGADVNADLIIAAKLKRWWIVQSLIFWKIANVNTKDSEGNSILLIGIELGDDISTDCIINTNGIDLNTQNKLGQTALIIAAKLKKWSIVKLLVQKGVNVNAKDSEGNSALLIAIEAGEKSIVELLVQKGANFPDSEI